MIKSELIASLSSTFSHLPERQIKQAVDCIIEAMANALSQGQRIEIRGFGAFSIKNIKARNTRNPKTGESILTPASRKVHFKQGLGLKKQINASKNTIVEKWHNWAEWLFKQVKNIGQEDFNLTVSVLFSGYLSSSNRKPGISYTSSYHQSTMIKEIQKESCI